MFIAFIQNWLLLALAVPLWHVQTNKSIPLNLNDLIAALIFVCFYATEIIADEQQWYFQTNKKKWSNNKSNSSVIVKFKPEEINDFKNGFLTRGLFR